MNLIKSAVVASIVTLTAGCASVDMASKEASMEAKQFNPPSEDMAGVYLYRNNSLLGASLKKDLWIDGDCVGESAKGVFFYEEVEDGEHEIATESEFSPNALKLTTKSGNHYFIEQYMKPGAFVHGANVKVVDNETGMEEVKKLEMALKGNCSSN